MPYLKLTAVEKAAGELFPEDKPAVASLGGLRCIMSKGADGGQSQTGNAVRQAEETIKQKYAEGQSQGQSQDRHNSHEPEMTNTTAVAFVKCIHDWLQQKERVLSSGFDKKKVVLHPQPKPALFTF